jgi:hypothetical protein
MLIFSHSTMAEVTEVLEKVANAYGGRTRIAEVTTYKQHGVIFSSMRRTTGDVLRAYRHPDHLRVEIKYDQHTSELRILAGANAWKHNEPTSGPFYSAMLLQAARLGLPSILLDHQRHVRDAGSMTGKQGDSLHALELNFHGKYQLIVGIDPTNGRILESHGIIKNKGVNLEFATTYHDFRFQDGRMFAFEEVHYAMGQKSGYTRIQRIEILSDLPEEIFHPSGLKNDMPDKMAETKKIQEQG